MAMKYSDKVMDHFTNPRNVGEVDNPDGIGEVGNPTCGDIMTFTIKVKDEKLEDVKFKTFGCGAAIAVSSMISEMAKGKSIDEALQISNRDVAAELQGLPASKMHCSNLGADALRAAIQSYQQAKEGGGGPEKVVLDHDEDEHDHDHEEVHHSACKCPHCNIELPEGTPVCKKCGKEVTCS